jgi:hypothetical protein
MTPKGREYRELIRKRAREATRKKWSDPEWRAKRLAYMRRRRRKQRADAEWMTKYRAGVVRRKKLRKKPGYRKRAYRRWS